MSNKCPVPECPAEKRQPYTKPNGCKCGEALMIVIPPGGHIHPCPVHPDYVVYGSGIMVVVSCCSM